MKARNDLETHYPIHAFSQLISAIEKVSINRLQDRLTPNIPFPHKHDFYQIIIVSRGKGWHEIDFVKHPVINNSLFVMKPGQVHSWALDPKSQGYVIEFELSAIQSSSINFDFLDQILVEIPDCMNANIVLAETLLALAENAMAELSDKKIGFETLCCFKLAEFLILVYRSLSKTNLKISKKDEGSRQFLKILEKHFYKQHQVDFYAQKMGLTTKTLSMRITRSLKSSPRLLIQNRCLLEAKRLLVYSSKSISQIGFDLGFEDPNYFSRFFKKLTGITPAAFRQKMLRTIA